jgi:hypothetical protein
MAVRMVSLQGKIEARYLHFLNTTQSAKYYAVTFSKNGILTVIMFLVEGHIKDLWTTDHKRQARTEKGVAFPSMEGALMSISFLIFAVFLIKLVQVCLLWNYL